MNEGSTIETLAPPAVLRPTGNETSDHALVAATRAGDDRAFECLYARYHRRIAAYVHGMVHDHARAEDITQDVFMSALRRMRQTDRPIAFKPWIYEIAKNACIDAFRRSRRAEEVSYDADEGLGASDYGRLVSPTATPDVAVDTKMRLDDLRGAFGGLSDTHHQILVMRELEGLSYREIGERLGMSRPSVESTLFRARRRLEEEYEDLSTGARCKRVQGIIAAAGGKAVGTRDQRRMSRHISYCQPCRRQARIAGLDVAVTARRPMREKIAALLPIPVFLKRRLGGGGPDATSGSSLGDHAPALAQWSAHLGAQGDGAIAGWTKAAAATAAVAIAGLGAGAAYEDGRFIGGFVPRTPIAAQPGGTGPSASPAVRAQSAAAARDAARLTATATPTPAVGARGATGGSGTAGAAPSAGTGTGGGTTGSAPANAPGGTQGAPSTATTGGGGGSGSTGTTAPAAGSPAPSTTGTGGRDLLKEAAAGLGLPTGSGSTGSTTTSGGGTQTRAPELPKVSDVVPSLPVPSGTPTKSETPVQQTVTQVTEAVDETLGEVADDVSDGLSGLTGSGG